MLNTTPNGRINSHFPWSIFFIFLAAFVVYFNSLFNGFVFDDIHNIVQNRWIKDIGYLPEIFTNHAAGFDRSFAPSYYRPIFYIINIMSYSIFGLKPWGFHLINVLFHAGVSVLVFLVASLLMEELPISLRDDHSPVSLERPATPVPFIAALLFAVHPIHTEAVAWVSGLMDLSFAFFFLLSFFLYMRAGGQFNTAFFLSVASFFLASLCKELALTLPLVLMTYDYLKEEGKPFHTYALKRYAAFFAVAAIYLLIRSHALGGFAPAKKFTGMDAYHLLLNIFPLFVLYLEKLLLPTGLKVLYVFHPVSSVKEVGVMFSVVLTSLFLIALLLLRKKRVVFFSMLLTVIPLLPALYIPGLGESVFAERYLYLPSIGFVMLAALLFVRIKAALQMGTLILTVPLLVLTVFYSVETLSRNAVWRSNYTLWADAVRKSPKNGVAHENLGYALYERGRVDEAIEEYKTALGLRPDLKDACINLAIAYTARGRIDEAIGQFVAALQKMPYSAEVHNGLGSALAAKGLTDAAIEEYTRGFGIKSLLPRLLQQSGNCLWK